MIPAETGANARLCNFEYIIVETEILIIYTLRIVLSMNLHFFFLKKKKRRRENKKQHNILCSKALETNKTESFKINNLGGFKNQNIDQLLPGFSSLKCDHSRPDMTVLVDCVSNTKSLTPPNHNVGWLRHTFQTVVSRIRRMSTFRSQTTDSPETD